MACDRLRSFHQPVPPFALSKLSAARVTPTNHSSFNFFNVKGALFDATANEQQHNKHSHHKQPTDQKQTAAGVSAHANSTTSRRTLSHFFSSTALDSSAHATSAPKPLSVHLPRDDPDSSSLVLPLQHSPSLPATVSSADTRDAPTPCSASVPTAAAAAPRVPLSSIVSVLVDEWSRSYTVEALKGDVESMCMVAQGHFSRQGWGCIPHDMQRGHHWLARAKATMIEHAAAEAKRFGRKPCMASTSSKAAELEEQCINDNVFELEGAPEAALDDNMSSGSIASLGSFSCDVEGGDTQGSFVDSVQVPLMEEHYAEAESDSGVGGFYSSAPTSHSNSVRNSVSHPDLSGEFAKAEFSNSGWSSALHSMRPTGSPIPSSEVLYEELEEGEEAAAPTAAEQEEAAATTNTNTDASSACDYASHGEQHEEWTHMDSYCATAPGSSADSSLLQSEADSPLNQPPEPLVLHASQAQMDKEFLPIMPTLRRAVSATN